MTNNDFVLSKEELQKLNAEIMAFAKRFAEAGEMPDDVQVLFSWTPGLGRSVDLQYSGSQLIEIS